jgi:hypothetical protein
LFKLSILTTRNTRTFAPESSNAGFFTAEVQNGFETEPTFEMACAVNYYIERDGFGSPCLRLPCLVSLFSQFGVSGVRLVIFTDPKYELLQVSGTLNLRTGHANDRHIDSFAWHGGFPGYCFSGHHFSAGCGPAGGAVRR